MKLWLLPLLVGVTTLDFYVFWPDWRALAIIAAIGVAGFMAGRSGRRAFPWEKS